jgi:hypothetical protein
MFRRFAAAMAAASVALFLRRASLAEEVVGVLEVEEKDADDFEA